MLSNVTKGLNKGVPIPLYYQLKEILLEYIKENPIDPEKPIPTEIKLSEFFGISRPTVRQAINELVVEGFLYRIKGKGTFTSKPKIKQDFLLVLDNFNNEMRKKGLAPSTKLLDLKIIKSDENVSEALHLSLYSDVFQLSRLRFADEEPNVFVVTYIPYNQCSNLVSEDLESDSLYEILEKKYNLIISKVTRVLEAKLASEYEAKLLHIEKGAPLQFFESIAYLNDSTPIEYSLANYRGDRNNFTFELRR